MAGRPETWACCRCDIGVTPPTGYVQQQGRSHPMCATSLPLAEAGSLPNLSGTKHSTCRYHKMQDAHKVVDAVSPTPA
jgi:hypothetical protein